MFISPDKHPGMEAIDFQKNTSLGKRLTACFQKVIDYRDGLKFDTDDATAQREERIRFTYQFFKDQTAEEFRKIVKDETGLTVKKFYFFGGLEYEVYGYFACDLAFDNIRDAVTTIGRITGTHNERYGKYSSIAEMAEMAQAFDTHTGRIRKPYFGKNRPFAVDMYFDVNCAFLSHDFVLNKVCEPYTAAEIAAIMMHEIGHALTVIEHSADMYVLQQAVRSHLNALKDDKSGLSCFQTLRELKEQLGPVLKNWSEKKKLNDPKATALLKNVSSTVLTAVDGLYTLAEKEANTNESWLISIGSFTFNLLVVAIEPIVSIIAGLYIWLIMEQCYEIMRHASVDNTYAGTKAGDVYTNYNNTFLLERWADEFVSRHGMGAELASALNKLDAMLSTGLVVGTVISARVRNSTLFNCIGSMMAWLEDKLSLLSYLDPIGYENQHARISRILENTYGVFKDKKIPGIMRDQYLRTIEEIKKQQAAAKTMSDTEFGKSFYRLLKDLMNPVQWIILLRNGDLAYDIEKLCNKLDAMSNNSLYYRSAQLQALR